MNEREIIAALSDAERQDISAWNNTLNSLWADIQKNELLSAIEKAELLHKFIASFDKLSKARRELSGLNAPTKTETTVTVVEPESIDAEYARLSAKLGMQKPKPIVVPTPDQSKPAQSI